MVPRSPWASFAGIFIVTNLGLLAVGATLAVLPHYVKDNLGGSDMFWPVRWGTETGSNYLSLGNNAGPTSTYMEDWTFRWNPTSPEARYYRNWLTSKLRVTANTINPAVAGRLFASNSDETGGSLDYTTLSTQYLFQATSQAVNVALGNGYIGTDRGDDFDASIVLESGMVLVLEPVVWDDGHCGHRSEEIVAITHDGYAWLSSRAELDGMSEPQPKVETTVSPKPMAAAQKIKPAGEKLLQHGFLALPEGNRNEILGLTPPLVITKRQLECCVSELTRLL